MLVLSRRCDERCVIGNDIVLNVIEIEQTRVRLGLVPPAGRPIELNDEDTVSEIVPEVQLTERGYQVLVWADLGSSIRVNEGVQVRIISMDRDRVRLGITAPEQVTVSREAAGPPTNALAAHVDEDVLRDWVARKITGYLKDRPRGALQELARAVGVSPVSIHRWRKRQTKVATQHLHALLEALGASEEDLARDLGTKQVALPEVRTRGPVQRGPEGAGRSS